MSFIKKLTVRGLLSFPSNMEEIEFLPLNILIGPNGSGKSNVIEVFELLRSTPIDFASAIRDGGGVNEWLWKDEASNKKAKIDVITEYTKLPEHLLRYSLEFTSSGSRVELLDEAIEEIEPKPGEIDPCFHYRFQHGHPVINLAGDTGARRSLKREDLSPDQSVLKQRKDPDLYPEVTWFGKSFADIQIFSDWTIGRYTTLRRPQPSDLSGDQLLPDFTNLALVLNQLQRNDSVYSRFNELLKRFLPRFDRMSTDISGGTVQFYLHESGLTSPIPPTRLSDGTLRFIALIAILLAPKPAPLVCIEEPELGMHPDAISMIGELLIEASERMQLIVTTHSEVLVSAMNHQPESVVTCERLGSSTILRRLNHEELEDWLNHYTLGDLWLMGHLGANP
ncbi:MAG: AAA family ATPase [Rhodobacteraceae bacterium]|nr:AAA family ATPase [Paracoccaceae bacterium]MCY4248975.1 AAA family ATPase [Paracoccaceae bacterium]MCY4308617.1 AAA family ATPase [Paracoccaceae bacterium]